MRIILTSSNGRYGFDVVNNSEKTIYSSRTHYFLTPSIRSSYKYAWEACRDAWNLVRKRKYHLRVAREDMEPPEESSATDVSAEDMLMKHYLAILRDLRTKAMGSVEEDDEYKEKTFKEIKMVVDELKNIIEQITDIKDKSHLKHILTQYRKLINKYFRKESEKEEKEELESAEGQMEADKAAIQEMPPSTGGMEQAPLTMGLTASRIQPQSETLDPILCTEILDEYAQRVCAAIQDKHRGCWYASNDSKIIIMDFDNTPLLRVAVNKQSNVSDVVPLGKLQEIHPLHSLSFYQKYWKPIAESIGHFCIGDSSILVITHEGMLPDSDLSKTSHVMEGWNCDQRKSEKITLSFRGEKPTWVFEPHNEIKTAQSVNPSKYTEQDYVNAIVKCIDKKLESIYGRTGTVVQIIPLSDMAEIDVDFGRGLGITRLIEKQIEIVPIGV